MVLIRGTPAPLDLAELAVAELGSFPSNCATQPLVLQAASSRLAGGYQPSHTQVPCRCLLRGMTLR